MSTFRLPRRSPFAPLVVQGLAAALLAAPLLLAPASPASAQIGIGFNITIAPPALPIYVQPPLPAVGYLWTPGYWDYGDAGYYWVPGTWVEPPQPGLLWTPGYWGWNNGVYVFNRGYWGDHVGFYGGINYGFGYTGVGFFGGEWRGGVFAYNSAVNNFGGIHVTNVFNRVVVNPAGPRVSFNGPNGINARPTPQEAAFAHAQHIPPTAMQMQHQQAAASNRALLASVNHGAPSIAATARAGDMRSGVVPARAAGAAGLPRPQEAPRPSASRPAAATHGAMAPHRAMAPHNAMEPRGAMAPAHAGGYHASAPAMRAPHAAPAAARGPRPSEGRGERHH